ncbi:hypothetical protein EBU94_05100 [bacterium]|nr:hypothetical protein [bacterium]
MYKKGLQKILLFMVVFFVIFCLFNFKVVKISGNSMKPILLNDSIAIIDSYTFKLIPLNKNDIYLFKVEGQEVLKKIKYFPLEEVNHKGKNLVLDKNEIYIIGENLPESIDSREYGPILTNQILGKVVLSF